MPKQSFQDTRWAFEVHPHDGEELGISERLNNDGHYADSIQRALSAPKGDCYSMNAWVKLAQNFRWDYVYELIRNAQCS